MYSLGGSRVPLNIPYFINFAATINFYTHSINVPGIFSCHMHISDLCHFLGQANSKSSSFLKLGSQTNIAGPISMYGDILHRSEYSFPTTSLNNDQNSSQCYYDMKSIGLIKLISTYIYRFTLISSTRKSEFRVFLSLIFSTHFYDILHTQLPRRVATTLKVSRRLRGYFRS